MRTATCSSRARTVGRAVADLGPLLRFRASSLRGRARTGVSIALGVILGLTVAAAWAPAFVVSPRLSREDVLILMPTGFLSVLIISIVSAIATGGGRELVHREQAVAFPISPTTDHLGALLMAPLNIAWLLQSWALLGMTAYAIGPRPSLLAAQVPVLLWLAAATATAQLFAWSVEWVRRGRPAGSWCAPAPSWPRRRWVGSSPPTGSRPSSTEAPRSASRWGCSTVPAATGAPGCGW